MVRPNPFFLNFVYKYKHMAKLRYIIYILFFSLSYSIFAQEPAFQNPFDFPILLSGNFGELRANHFHSGIDFKTQGVEGKPVHAVQDGYISRIGVSPWGYGNVLYMNHPDGTTTVYAHLQKFDQAIAKYVKEQQYEKENFTINLYPDSSLFPYNKGEVIALAGNSGSSAGPHLHFEVRDTQTEEVLDPLHYYKDRTKDTRAPQIRGMKIYPMPGKGIVNGSTRSRSLKITTPKNSKQPIVADKIEAWGDIALGIKAFDSMDGTSNIYGVKEIILMKDSDVVFKSRIDQYAFEETRYLNSFIDYAEWRQNGSFVMKSYVEPGNRLRFMNSLNRGIITINEEKVYQISYLLADIYGNTSTLAFKIQGKRQEIPEIGKEETTYFNWSGDNRFGAKGIRLTVPRGNLYSDVHLQYWADEDSMALSALHILHSEAVPLHHTAQLAIRLQNDTLENKHQYGIVSIHKGRTSWIGGTYRNGWIQADIKELLAYRIQVDSLPPVITPIDPATWAQKKQISIRLSDRLSGVDTYRGEIDGCFVLFEFDGKKGLLTYRFDPERLSRGSHELHFTATDACGNRSTYTRRFVW